MKSIKKISVTILLVFFIALNTAISQPPPPPGDGDRTSSSQTGGSDAPIAGGLFILLGLGGAYAGFKLYKTRRKLTE